MSYAGRWRSWRRGIYGRSPEQKGDLQKSQLLQNFLESQSQISANQLGRSSSGLGSIRSSYVSQRSAIARRATVSMVVLCEP